MSAIIVEPFNKHYGQNQYHIQPGPKGSIGDWNQNFRLPQSSYDMPVKYAENKPELLRKGTGLQDGMYYNSFTGGYGAKINDISFYTSPYKVQKLGDRYQDLRPNDITGIARQQDIPRLSWRFQKARLFNAKTTGKQFLPLPAQFRLRGVPKGIEPERFIFSGPATSIYTPSGISTGNYRKPTDTTPNPTPGPDHPAPKCGA
jgi:hypothetical protein